MTTDTTTAQDLTEPTRVLLAAAGASPSTATLWELVDVRGEVTLGIATLSGEVRAEVDALLAANASGLVASRWLGAPVAELEAALDRLHPHAERALARAGLDDPEVHDEIEAAWRDALRARDAVELRVRGAAPDATVGEADEARLLRDDRWLRALLADLLSQAAFRAAAPPRPASFWWWTARVGCDRKVVAALAIAEAAASADVHVATCDACAGDLERLVPVLRAVADLPSQPLAVVEAHLSYTALVEAVTLRAAPSTLAAAHAHLAACPECAEHARALEVWLRAPRATIGVTDVVPTIEDAGRGHARLLRHIARVRAARDGAGGITLQMLDQLARPAANDGLRFAASSEPLQLDPTNADHRVVALPEGTPADLELLVAEAWGDDRATGSFVVVTATRATPATKTPRAPIASAAIVDADGSSVPFRLVRVSPSAITLAFAGTGTVDLSLRFAGETTTLRLRFERSPRG